MPDSEDDKRLTQRAMIGAAAVGGVAGFCLIGPLFGVVGAAAAAYATTNDSQVGDVARKTGQVTCVAFDEAQEFCKKNDIWGRIQDAGRKTLDAFENAGKEGSKKD